MRIGERVHNIERAINSRVGMTKRDDRPPDGFFEEQIKSGPGKGDILEKDKFEDMLDEYYTLRGWDKETDLPTREKLEELDLEEVADELHKYGKLAE